ncbi:MAG: hypothetical protein ACR2LK_05540 [Solirubrobacteraceae bacterium]
MNAAERASLLADLQRLWHGHSDMRFGQMLRVAVGDPAIRSPHELSDAEIVTGTRTALSNRPGLAPGPVPYWDTEASRGRTFVDGLPRDPARIPRVLTALAAAWDAHPSSRLGELLDLALERGGVPENEYGSRLLLIEDGPLRRMIGALTTPRDD